LRAIHVVTARERKERKIKMKTYTIDEQNNITVFGSKEEAAGATGLAFSSQDELAKLTAEWPISRFIEIWNGFAGVAPFGELKPVKKFTDRKVAVARIWQAIQRLSVDGVANSVAEPEAQLEPAPVAAPEAVAEIAPEPVTEATCAEASVPEVTETAETPTGVPQVSDVAPEVGTATTDASPAKNAPTAEQIATKAPKRKKAAKPERQQAAPQPAAPRESKTAQVVAMLQRPEGATITEIMQKMGWLKHTVRGFMAGTMKKAGYNVESFKPEGGERSYRIAKENRSSPTRRPPENGRLFLWLSR
jgi:hypothetical protein